MRLRDGASAHRFAPPECFNPGEEIRGRPRDVWSCRCVLFVMLFGSLPFWAPFPLGLQLKILQEEVAFPTDAEVR